MSQCHQRQKHSRAGCGVTLNSHLHFYAKESTYVDSFVRLIIKKLQKPSFIPEIFFFLRWLGWLFRSLQKMHLSLFILYHL